MGKIFSRVFSSIRRVPPLTSPPSRGREKRGPRQLVAVVSVTTILSSALSACSLAPSFQRPQMAVPGGWSDVAGVGTQSQRDGMPFWQALGSAELNGLIDTALAQNLDLEAALHRIEEARGQVKVAGSSLYPTIQVSGSSARTVKEPLSTSAAQGVGSINYEIDLWGKNRNSADAAKYRAGATEFDRDALRLVVTSDVTTFYTQILSLNDRIRIAENNLKNAEEVLRIIEARFNAGSASGLEVSQQRVAVNGFRAALTNLTQQRTQSANALAILLGTAPQNFSASQADLASLKMPQVNLTPPADLLTARPDIESAEAGLRAANADIGVARAEFFPSLTLGNAVSIATSSGSPAISAANLAANLLAPIFTGGKLTGNLESVTARQKELAAQYQKTVLTAFQEVEDALAALKSNNEQAVLSQQSVTESQNAYNIAKARFDAGAIDFLDLLQTQGSLYQAQENQIVVNQGQLASFVQLRKAMGA
jgi:outer membrane protein, multidrug efflux system